MTPTTPAAAEPTAATPAPFKFPQAAHARRLPAGIEPEALRRIQQAAYHLPQVVKPADFAALDDDAAQARTDTQLDRLGLILLQKAAAGARPSRWIHPQDIAAALRHLDAVGGQGQRPLMAERSAALDTLGVSRHGLQWERLAVHPLTIDVDTGGTERVVPVTHRLPVEADAVWAYYCSGDLPTLQAALGPVPAYPQAEALKAELEALVRRSASGHPQHLAALLPRLQAECARPQPLAAMQAACRRAQERWEHRASELEALAGLTTELAFQGYPDSFETARELQRSVTLYVGPPNSGKTYAAFARLAQAHDGAYLAPLRLLALEGRDRLVAQGVSCSLLTGEENVPAPDARVVSSTIEMVNTTRPIDVAVIDEAQMLFDASRGWAWTQAIVGVPANEVVIICSAYAVPAIENLLRLCGERCTVRHFERKQHVQLLDGPVPMSGLRKGDAVVAFSRRDVLMLRDQVAQQGHPVSVIYGALPPEVRRREAERFAHGHADVLVATDAIGMGLNLPIRRVLFSTLTKFDGVADRPLEESEVHQIAGRAGRYGMHEEGFVGVLREAEPEAARLLKELLPRPPRAPRDFKASVAPNPWHIQTIASRLGLDRLRDILGVFIERLRLDDAHFRVAELDAMFEMAGRIDEAAGRLSLRERFVYAQAPVDLRAETQVEHFLEWAHAHAHTGRAGSPWFLDEVDAHSRLDRMEQALRACTLWLWLDLRFPGIYGHVDAVSELRRQLNNGIERQLKGHKPLAQMRRGPRRARA